MENIPNDFYEKNNNPLLHLLQRESEKEQADIFFLLILPTLLYASFFTIFLYGNYASITMVFFVLASLVFSFHMLKKSNRQIKMDSLAYAAVMVLLAISDFLTANPFFLFFNFLGILLLNIFLFIYNYYDSDKWHPLTYTLTFIRAIVGMAGHIFSPFFDFSSYRKEKDKPEHKINGQIVLGFVIAFPILVLILALLSSADPVFARLVSNIFQLNWIFKSFFGVFVTFLISFMLIYGFLRFLKKYQAKDNPERLKKWNFALTIPLLSLLSLSYIIFSCIQIFYLFLGRFTLPTGYSYSAYAREGFFQLLLVSLINIVLVLFVLWFFKEHLSVKILLTVLSLSTYIMIASSAVRMFLYIQNYHLTPLRIFVLWALLLLVFLLTGVLLFIYRENFPLFRYSLLVSSFLFALLSLARPDYIVASYNLAHIEKISSDYDYRHTYKYPSKYNNCEGDSVYDYRGEEDYPDYDNQKAFDYSKYSSDQFSDRVIDDYGYLEDLSADAAPAIVKSGQKRLIYNYKQHITIFLPPNDLRHANLSFIKARSLLGIKKE